MIVILIDQQFPRFSGQLHVEADERQGVQNYCKKNKLRCQVAKKKACQIQGEYDNQIHLRIRTRRDKKGHAEQIRTKSVPWNFLWSENMLVLVHEFLYLYGHMKEISSYFRSRYILWMPL